MLLTPQLAQAQRLLQQQKFAEAIPAYRKMLARQPREPLLWMDLAAAAAGAFDCPTAAEALGNVCSLAARNRDILLMAGGQYRRLRWLDGEEACYRAALALEPRDLPVRLALAEIHERLGRLDAAYEELDACGQANAARPAVRLLAGTIDRRAGRFEAAESRLRALLDGPADPASRLGAAHELARVLDETARPAEAMDLLRVEKARISTTPVVRHMAAGYDHFSSQWRAVHEALTPDALRRWRESTGATDSPPVVLLCGHPRSGTTLIESLLERDPRVAAFEEVEAFASLIGTPLAAQAGTRPLLPLLDTLSPGARKRHAAAYLGAMANVHGARLDRRTLLDKNPSETFRLPCWARILPTAKWLVALRDPRDVVISCYFLRVPPNQFSVQFLSLEGTVRHYRDLIDTWLRLRSLTDAGWLETRYEDIVRSTPAELARVRDFVLEGTPAARAEHPAPDTAPQRPTTSAAVFSPNYQDAGSSPHTRSVARWQRYETFLSPVLNDLQPYLRALGYDE